MSFDAALRLTEILLGFALLQASLEHVLARREQPWLFAFRAVLSALLIAGIAPAWTVAALLVVGCVLLTQFDGPYNGGADRMSLLVLTCLMFALWLPEGRLRELALGYVAIQLVLSYVLSGAVKIVNPDWRTGVALRDVFLFSAYPISEQVRRLAERPRLLLVMSWCVILFELAFPIALLAPWALAVGLAIAIAFHLANAMLFGLNRFVWAWLAAYPSLLWLQPRIMGGV